MYSTVVTCAHRTCIAALALWTLTPPVLAAPSAAQDAAPSSPLTLVTAGARTPLPTSMVAGREMIALEDLAAHFPLAIRGETVADSVRVSYRDRAILVTPDQPLVSVDGRLVSLPAPAIRAGRRLLVPVEFIDRAFGLLYEEPIDLRKPSRLLIVGALRVPRVTVRYEPRADDTLRVLVDIAPAAGHAIVQEPKRLLVRLEADALDVTLPPPPPQNLLESVRVLGADTIELVTGSRFASYRSSMPASTPASSRVLVELLPTAPAVSSAADPAPRPAAADPPPFLSAPRPLISTVVIDPGHGGGESGARGASGTATEKDLTLAVARQLKHAIEARYGIRVLQTRDDDRHVGLDERAAYANNAKADLFISLHANASPRPRVRGAEVFYLELDRYGDEARRRARLDGTTLPAFGSAGREIELVPWDLAQARHVDRSAVLARMVEEQLGTRVEVSRRGVQQGPLRVLQGVNMPAVLIELGYLTNREQEAALASGAYQAALVQAITDAVETFRDYLGGDTTPAPGRGAAAPAAPGWIARR